MGNTFQIALDDFDVGQLLDGLSIRAEAWRKTADYMDTGESPEAFFACEECSDAVEARKIAEHYERIIANIETQIELQRAP
jgi:hypothetical protein